MPICSVCLSIDLVQIFENFKWSRTIGRSTLGRDFPHHDTYAALRTSAETCPSCTLFYEPTNADPKYPNKPGIGEDDPVTLCLNKDYNYNTKVELIGALQFCVQVWSKTERHRGIVSYIKYVDVWADDGEIHADVLISSADYHRHRSPTSSHHIESKGTQNWLF